MFVHNMGSSQCEIRTNRVTVFKDATAFIEREGMCKVENNEILLDVPYQGGGSPNVNRYGQSDSYNNNHIILGSVQILSPGNEILSSRSINVEADEDLKTIQSIFDSNKGKEMSITRSGTKEVINGKLFSVDNGSKSLVLQDGALWSFVKMDEIANFKFRDSPILQKKTTRKKLKLRLSSNADNQELNISYLQKGITWTPNYFIDIQDDNILKLSLKANIMNDIVDLNNADVNLAVGIPVFDYSLTADPLFSNQRVIDLVNSLNNPGASPNRLFANAITSQSATSYSGSGSGYANSSLDGQSTDDIFLYRLKNISLDKSERLNVDILDMESEYKDVYVVDLDSNNDKVSLSNSKKKSDNTEVWHALKFDNVTGEPLTTGTVIFKKNMLKENEVMPLSQGQLNFTPVDKPCIVKMSVSPNITVEQSDVEVSRVRNPDGNGYIVNVSSEIEINNLKNEKVKIMVTRMVKGMKIEGDSNNWKIVKSGRSLYDRNQSNLVEWNFDVEPNQKKNVKYSYQVLMW